MEIEEGLISEDRTEGFLTIKNFDGETVLIDIEKLSALLEFILWVRKRGAVTVHIGIGMNADNKTGLLVAFLDRSKTVGYGIASHEEFGV